MLKKITLPHLILAALVVVFIAGGLFFLSQPAQAQTISRWVNRSTIEHDGQIFKDVNTTDITLDYVAAHTGHENCPATIRFTLDDTSNNSYKLDRFFFASGSDQYVQDATNPTYFPPVATRDANNQVVCSTGSSQNLTLSAVPSRMVGFIRMGVGSPQIMSHNGRVTFERTTNRGLLFARQGATGVCDNTDLLLLRQPFAKANTFEDRNFFSAAGWSEGQAVAGQGNIQSAVLYSVQQNGSNTSESFGLVYGNNRQCAVRNERLYDGNTYELAWADPPGGFFEGTTDTHRIGRLLAWGINYNGQRQSKDDDAFIAFVGTLEENWPTDAQGNPVNPGAPAPGAAAPSQPVCGIGAGWGWLLCPIMVVVDSLLTIMENLITPFLQVAPLRAAPDNQIYQLWNAMRNIANVVFIIAFLVIVFSQATGVGISNYGIKRLLPRVIAVAVLANISFFITAFVVDLGNVAGAAIEGLAVGLIGNNGAISINVADTVQTTQDISGLPVLGLYSLGGGIIGALLVVQGIEVIVAPIIVAVLMFLVALVILALRLIVINIIIILSSLLAVAWLLPNTANFANRIVMWFLQLIALYPLVVLGFIVGKIVATLIFSSIPQGDT